MPDNLKTIYFKFCEVESGSQEKCDVMMANQMQCPKRVAKHVQFTPPTTQNSLSKIIARNYCEAHFQIEYAKAQRDEATIVNTNEEAELTKLKTQTPVPVAVKK